MNRVTNGLAARRLLGVVAILAPLFSSSGCILTPVVWKWASERVPRSRVVGVSQTSDGEEVVVFNVKKDADRPDGYHAFRIPTGWQDMPTRRSAWGNDIQEPFVYELEQLVTSLVPVAETPGWSGTR